MRPESNKDSWRSQIARQVNVSPINDIGMRKVKLAIIQDKTSFNKCRRRKLLLMSHDLFSVPKFVLKSVNVAN